MSQLLLKTWVNILNKTCSNCAYKWVKSHMLRPVETHHKWPKSIKRTVYKTKFGKLRTYQAGHGKCIWLVHGWSNAHEYWPLIEKLLKQGYQCIAIEMLPSKSKEKVLSLPNWINAFDIATRSLPEPTHVVAHGLAASILGNSLWLSRYQENLTLLSPVLNFDMSVGRYCKRKGLPDNMLNRLKRDMYKQDKIKLSRLNATQAINDYDGELTIFYSKKDDISTVGAIDDLSQRSNQRIVQFKGADSSRIINSRSLMSVIRQQPKALDITL
ncbi:esterase [Thalassotalea loyana]|uniref:Esterase n=1 Tax=Thalassotalea loyana TaxID=280483 RepID=A0ABQ6HD49_9GAMM|nr:hypothetical protein [Thalassotalea loyana]GLX85991.1 esterase [Thalassotalea loyana]